MSGVTRAVDVMDLLARDGPLGVRAISKALSLPTGSTHRLLADLEEASVAERGADGDWDLSLRLLEITGYQLERMELSHIARPFVERIAAATRETVNVTAPNGFEGVCIDKVRGADGMQFDLRIGSRAPLYVGGAGKAILAYRPESEVEHVIRSPKRALTPNTLIDADVLADEIRSTRARGYAIDDQEFALGVYCVAVPVLDRSGRAAGALSVAGPSPKAPGPDIEPLVTMLNEAAQYVSRRLGYTGPWPNLGLRPSLVPAGAISPRRS